MGQQAIRGLLGAIAAGALACAACGEPPTFAEAPTVEEASDSGAAPAGELSVNPSPSESTAPRLPGVEAGTSPADAAAPVRRNATRLDAGAGAPNAGPKPPSVQPDAASRPEPAPTPDASFSNPPNQGQANTGTDAAASPAEPTSPVCEDACERGATTCSDAALRTCVVNDNGCTGWGAATASEHGACQDDQGCHPCEDACAVSETQCTAGAVRSCEVGVQGCTTWSQATACGPGGCLNARACNQCSDACTLGATACQDGALRRCAAGSDGCTVWSAPAACADGFCRNAQTCGQCPADGACNTLGASCVNGDRRVCTADPATGCRTFTSSQTCDAACVAGECKAGLGDSCSTSTDCAQGSCEDGLTGQICCQRSDCGPCAVCSTNGRGCTPNGLGERCATDMVCNGSGSCIQDAVYAQNTAGCVTAANIAGAGLDDTPFCSAQLAVDNADGKKIVLRGPDLGAIAVSGGEYDIVGEDEAALGTDPLWPLELRDGARVSITAVSITSNLRSYSLSVHDSSLSLSDLPTGGVWQVERSTLRLERVAVDSGEQYTAEIVDSFLTIVDSEFFNGHAGLRLTTRNSARISGSRFHNNFVAGILVDGSDHNISLEDCVIEDNARAMGESNGIHIRSTSDATVQLLGATKISGSAYGVRCGPGTTFRTFSIADTVEISGVVDDVVGCP